MSYLVTFQFYKIALIGKVVKIIVLYVLSQIWKFGGVIERDKSDNQLVLKNHLKVPKPILDDAAKVFDDIDAFLLSVEGMKPVDRFMWNIVAGSAGWQKNESIDNFFRSDEKVVNLYYEYTLTLARNGWVSPGQDWRQFETAESNKIKKEIFERAVAFKKGAK